MSKRIFIDYSNFFFRSLHAHIKLATSKGVGTGAAYGMIQNLLYLCIKYGWSGKQIVLIKDGKPRKKFEIFPEYKKGRKQLELPPSMSVSLQFKICDVLMHHFGIISIRNLDYECDDLMRTYTNSTPEGTEAIVISSDHDMYQCLKPNVSMLLCHNEGEEIFNEDKFVKKYGIMPEDFWKAQVLAGCSTDKVPGMVGIGDLTAINIIKMNAWDKIINNDPELKFPDKRSQTMFRKNHSIWNPNREEQLVKLQTNTKGTITPGIFNKDAIQHWFTKFEFNHYLNPMNFHKICKIFGSN